MAYFAELDQNNTVIQTWLLDSAEILNSQGQEDEAIGEQLLKSRFGGHRFLQCSYTGRIRKNYPGEGYTYDAARDAFIPPKPFDSWTLNEDTCQWRAPSPYPADGHYNWNEQQQQWVTP
jgi:hypothetical protein